jgi:hypothetical protein
VVSQSSGRFVEGSDVGDNGLGMAPTIDHELSTPDITEPTCPFEVPNHKWLQNEMVKHVSDYPRVDLEPSQ